MLEAWDSIQFFLLLLLRYLLILVVSYLFAVFSFPALMRLFQEAGLVKPNYRKENIPASAGVLFAVVIPTIIGLGIILRVPSFTAVHSYLFLFVIVAMGFMGFFDDQLGSHMVKGFKGHFRALFLEKRLTTGAFKAMFGAVIALIFSLGTVELFKVKWPVWSVIINFLLVVLAANTINIFDLRPGRAGKIYLFGFVIILLCSKYFEDYIGLFLPILAIMIYYLPFDLKAKVMMGDSGANLVGASLGMMMAWMLTDISKIVALVILVVIQIAAEKVSFTEVIENSSWLKVLDQAGRGKE
jgi:UDP-N-acetylmuramyl pentapeptide phosphotransferase/UDP-N-acetylglucosamine-1-phosphate transferase